MTTRLPEFYPHLPLVRTDTVQDRRRRRGGPPPVRANPEEHGRHISESVDSVLRQFSIPSAETGIDPALIFKIRLDGSVDEDEWRRSGLVVLSREPGSTLILFSNDQELLEFRNRLSSYQAGPQGDQIHPSYNNLFATISEDGLVPLSPEDRIGARLSATPLLPEALYFLDLEIWPLGNQVNREARASQVREHIQSNGGEVLDQIINESMVILRISVPGGLVTDLLEIQSVARLDIPPQPTLTAAEIINVTLADLEPVPPPNSDISVCVVDSGITRGHPLLGPAIGETAMFPPSLGTPDDEHGHGTLVAGIAEYGDVEACISARTFNPGFVLYSARVLNAQNEFDDRTLVYSQMREAISYFSDRGCRIFNISLGDSTRLYDDGRNSAWAAVLDQLGERKMS